MMKLITVKDAANILSVPTWKVYELVRQEILPRGVTVRIGRLVRFNPDELETWIQSGGQRHSDNWAKQA